jgi:hypothetical protein
MCVYVYVVVQVVVWVNGLKSMRFELEWRAEIKMKTKEKREKSEWEIYRPSGV